MGTSTAGTGRTYDDLVRTRPASNRFEELIDGELIVSPAPEVAHQLAVGEVFARLREYTREHGGRAMTGPADILVEPTKVVQPDVLLISAAWLERHQLVRPLTSAPDLVVEVLSPSNRRHDLIRKRAIYEQFGVPELWFADTDLRTTEACVLTDHRYVSHEHAAGETLRAQHLDGLAIAVGDLFDD